MTTIHKLISAWMLTLLGSLLLPLVSFAAVSGTTYDTASTTMAAPATIAERTTAIETVSCREISLRSMASGQIWSLLGRSHFRNAPKSIKTPYGSAVQENSAAALRVRSQVQQGGAVYKGGVLGRSETGASQFLATESPLNPGYAGRYGIPPKNANFDFVITGRVKPGAPVITRSAPGIPPNPGGGVEGVINSGDLIMDSFVMP